MAKLSRVGAVASYFRKYHLAPRYGRARRVALMAADGTRLAAHRLAGPPDAPCTVVLVHGFVNWSRTPAIHAFATTLADEVDVIVPDLRGHGRSAGTCTLGRNEPLDVAAAVSAADPSKPVVTVGVSLGGAAVLLHAGQYPGSVAGVVAVSAPATWGGLGTDGANRIERWISTRGGRFVLRALLRTRLTDDCADLPDASDVAGAIAPAFLILVADPDDWYFGAEHPQRIYEWAKEPKSLWWYPEGGHGTDLLTTAFAARLLAAVEQRLAAAPASGAPGGEA
ncbi:MAG: lysophospholipase [Actinomycetota bacterium]|nr:lysophospholipase [Actinomycetota bacterium]